MGYGECKVYKSMSYQSTHVQIGMAIYEWRLLLAKRFNYL